jgi:hypothetical protein
VTPNAPPRRGSTVDERKAFGGFAVNLVDKALPTRPPSPYSSFARRGPGLRKAGPQVLASAGSASGARRFLRAFSCLRQVIRPPSRPFLERMRRCHWLASAAWQPAGSIHQPVPAFVDGLWMRVPESAL